MYLFVYLDQIDFFRRTVESCSQVPKIYEGPVTRVSLNLLIILRQNKKFMIYSERNVYVSCSILVLFYVFVIFFLCILLALTRESFKDKQNNPYLLIIFHIFNNFKLIHRCPSIWATYFIVDSTFHPQGKKNLYFA